MKTINGKKIAEKIKDDLAKNVYKEIQKGSRHPALAVILIGQREESKLYVSLKEKAAKEVGIDFSLYLIDENEKETNIIETIKFLNKDKSIDGILVQLPLPKKFNTNKILQTISPHKDIDGFCLNNKKVFFSPVIMAIEHSLKDAKINLINKKAFLFFNSEIFKEEVQSFFKKEKIKLESISMTEFKKIEKDEKKLKKLQGKVRQCQILISAVGRSEFIDKNFLSDELIIVDIGIVKEKNKVLGDIKYSDTKNFSGFITPVPGGIGPMTVACLLKNTLKAFLYGKQ